MHPRPPNIEMEATTELPNSLPLATSALLAIQQENGCWEGEMVWCTMILSQTVIVRWIVGRPWTEAERARIIRHYEVTVGCDGAWGLHPESAGYVFTTTLAYVALRLLGLDPNHSLLARTRQWLHQQPGGVLGIPTWGKFWLAMLGLYGYSGLNPFPPEIFLLPKWLPFHPRRYYCHTRLIYMAMAYLYGRRFVAPLGALEAALRQELYETPYESIDFAAHRHDLALSDVYVRPAAILRRAFDSMTLYERRPIRALRRRALDYCYDRIQYEQQATHYQGLSPVNALLNCLVLWSTDRNDPELSASLDGLESWRWEDDAEGLRYVGARSQTWDTAFATQALATVPTRSPETQDALQRAYRFLKDTQLVCELPDLQRELRDPILGGWCFSDGRHRWPVSDCTAEAVSAVLALHQLPDSPVPSGERIGDDRLLQAIQFIVQRQNDDGSFGTYEKRRGSQRLERFNPSEMFGQCMTEGSYVECTGSALAALAHFQAAVPGAKTAWMERALVRGRDFLCRSQRPDGSFPAFWGINFTYAIFHAVRGLRAAGVAATDPVLARAADWLLGKQRADGGWGEHYRGCLEQRYVEHPESQVVMTSWALLALLDVLDASHTSIRRGIDWLKSQQAADGSWPQQAVNGVFFGTAMLDYRLYKSYFPTWVLARYAALKNEEPHHVGSG